MTCARSFVGGRPGFGQFDQETRESNKRVLDSLQRCLDLVKGGDNIDQKGTVGALRINDGRAKSCTKQREPARGSHRRRKGLQMDRIAPFENFGDYGRGRLCPLRKIIDVGAERKAGGGTQLFRLDFE